MLSEWAGGGGRRSGPIGIAVSQPAYPTVVAVRWGETGWQAMADVQLWQCDRLYPSAGHGARDGYTMLLAGGVGGYLLLPGIRERATILCGPNCVFNIVLSSVLLAFCVYGVLEGVHQVLLHANGRVGPAKDGVIVQDWLRKRRVIPWGEISGLTVMQQTFARRSGLRLAVEVRGYAGRVVLTPGVLPGGADYGKLRDAILEHVQMREIDPSDAGHVAESRTIWGLRTRFRVWRRG